jgi:MoxR-like ATPase
MTMSNQEQPASLSDLLASLKAITPLPVAAVGETEGPAVVRTDERRPIDAALAALAAVRQEILGNLVDREDALLCALIGLVARRHAILLGPPGTAKSFVIRMIAERAGLDLLLTEMHPQTPAEEILGPLSVKGLEEDDYRRITAGKLPEAELWIAEELFNGPPSTFGSIHRILNERMFMNGSAGDQPVPLQVAYAATNQFPQEQELAAFLDRWVLRTYVGRIRPEQREALLTLGAETHAVSLSRGQLVQVQERCEWLTRNMAPDARAALLRFLEALDDAGIYVSDRTIRALPSVMAGHALLRGCLDIEPQDVEALRFTVWTDDASRAIVERAARVAADPLLADAMKVRDEADEAHRVFVGTYKPELPEVTRKGIAVRAKDILKDAAERVHRIGSEARQPNTAARCAGYEREIDQWISRVMRAELGTDRIGGLGSGGQS